jgi:hypothetical protein
MSRISGIKTSFQNSMNVVKRIGPKIRKNMAEIKKTPMKGILRSSMEIKAAKAKFYRAILFNKTAARLERRAGLDADRLSKALGAGKKIGYSPTAAFKGAWNHVVGYVDMLRDIVWLPIELGKSGIKYAKKTPDYAKRAWESTKNFFSKKPVAESPKALTSSVSHAGDTLVLKAT